MALVTALIWGPGVENGYHSRGCRRDEVRGGNIRPKGHNYLGLEEVEFDEQAREWRVTVRFSRSIATGSKDMALSLL